MTLEIKKVEIFCGTGGVGKTTIATSRALHLASKGYKILLITIDPAKRLKQILKIEDDMEGTISTVSSKLFETDREFTFDAILMSPGATLKKIAIEKGLEAQFRTNIINTLSKPNSGMNEIMSIIEVQLQIEKNQYDSIILDTPPGKHFLDFLEASEKIKNFFDKSFLEIFEYLGKTTSNEQKEKKGLFNKLISSGLNKLLSYLEKVTGGEFVQEFIDTVLVLYKSRDIFLKALHFQEDLKKRNFSNWFLVTSVEQQKTKEATELSNSAEKFLHEDNYLIINKSNLKELENWDPENLELLKLKNALLKREHAVDSYSKKHYSNIIKFNEIYIDQPTAHVKAIATQFENL